jgi:TetR/AcrR family tetracycline transcriptional repressor
MKDDKIAKKLAHLEEVQRKTQERLAKQHQRVNERFDRAREQILKKYGEPSHSQQRIIDAAIDLLNEDGLNNFSLRKLAGMVDMKAPALYWHFKSKEALIDYMAEAILQAEFKDLEPRQTDELWQDWLIKTCMRLRNAMRAHRDGARVVAGAHLYPAVTLMKLFEVSMESLTSAGMELQRANLIITTAVHFVFGNVIEEQAAPSLDELKNMDSTKLTADYPLMAKSIQQTYQDMLNGHDEFEDSLRLIIEPTK